MLIRADSGGEKFIPWAKSKLAQWKAEMIREGRHSHDALGPRQRVVLPVTGQRKRTVVHRARMQKARAPFLF